MVKSSRRWLNGSLNDSLKRRKGMKFRSCKFLVRIVLASFALQCPFAGSARAQQPATEGISYKYPLGENMLDGYDGSKRAVRLFALKGAELVEKGSIAVDETVTAMEVMPAGYVFATGMGHDGAPASIKV
jgi:hypothetical protein